MNEPETTDSRVVRLDTQVAELTRQVGGLGAAINRIESALSSVGKFNAGNWIAGAMLVLFAGGGLWAMAIRPLDDRVNTTANELRRSVDRLDDLVRRQTATEEAFKEVETQFRMSGIIANMRHERDWMHVQLLWRRVYSEDLPPMIYFPEAGKVDGIR